MTFSTGAGGGKGGTPTPGLGGGRRCQPSPRVHRDPEELTTQADSSAWPGPWGTAGGGGEAEKLQFSILKISKKGVGGGWPISVDQVRDHQPPSGDGGGGRCWSKRQPRDFRSLCSEGGGRVRAVSCCFSLTRRGRWEARREGPHSAVLHLPNPLLDPGARGRLGHNSAKELEGISWKTGRRRKLRMPAWPARLTTKGPRARISIPWVPVQIL